MLIALPIGILSALKPRSLIDRGAMIFILIGISRRWSGSASCSSTSSVSSGG
jgi:hypothetical protein